MTDTAEQLRDAVAPPDTGHRGLPGASVRVLTRGDLIVNVYDRDDGPWLSTSSVLRIMRYGELPPELADSPQVDYGRKRGKIVGEAVEGWIAAGCPDPDVFGYDCDRQLDAWREAQARNWQRFTVVPYLRAMAAYGIATDFQPTFAEQLVENEATRTFGYYDAGDGVRVAEVKTSARVYRAHVLQAASYVARPGQADVVRLQKDGTYERVTVTADDVEHFAWLARSAHELVEEWAA